MVFHNKCICPNGLPWPGFFHPTYKQTNHLEYRHLKSCYFRRLELTDKRGGQPWKATNYRNSLVNLMEELNVSDIYQQIHPTTKSFTYESKPLHLKWRINFFLISRPVSCRVKSTEIRPLITPDQKSIFLNIDFINKFARGPGLRKLNNTLLEDENYKELIEFYPQTLEYHEITDK